MAGAPVPPLMISSGPALSGTGPTDSGGWTGFGDVYFAPKGADWSQWVIMGGLAWVAWELWRKR